eukprot:431663_1
MSDSTEHTKATDNTKLHALQRELLQYKHDNEHLRTQLKNKTNTLNATILKKSQQIHEQEVRLKEEIAQYSNTKAVYQTIIDEHKSLKSQIETLQNQLTQSQSHVEQKTIAFDNAIQSFTHKENAYKDMIATHNTQIKTLKQRMKEMQNTHQIQTKQLEEALQLESDQSTNEANDFIALIVHRMSEQTEKRDETQLMASKLNDVTFTELQARFSELILAFQKEYNAHQVTLSQMKQFEAQTYKQHVEIESIKSQMMDSSNEYHNIRLKCHQYEAMYGEMNTMNHDTLSLQHSLKQTVDALNDCKQQIRTLCARDSKEREIKQQISAQNNELQGKVQHLEQSVKDKDDAMARYKKMNAQLSNVLRTLREHKNDKTTHEDDRNQETKDKDDEESELELCQRMYRDEIVQLQHTMDQCSKERSVVEGQNAKLRQQYHDLYQQNQSLNESKAYLNQIIKKQKLKCSNLTSNISEQQVYLQKIQTKYTQINDEYLQLNTKYLEIQMKHDLLQQNKDNNNKENLNYRIQYAELRKLIASLKNESKTYKQQYTQINNKYKTLEQMHKNTEDRLHVVEKEDTDKKHMIKENEALKSTIEGLQKTISSMEREMNTVSKQLEVSLKNESLIPNLKSEITHLNEQIEELKVNLSIVEQKDTTNESVATPNNRQRMKELRQIAAKAQLEHERLTHQIGENQSYYDSKTREWTHKLQQYQNKLDHVQGMESKQNEQIDKWKDRYTKAQARYERELKNHARSLQDMKALKQQMSASESSITSTKSGDENETKRDLHCAVLEAELIACKATVDRLKNENQIIGSELIAIKEEVRTQQHDVSYDNTSGIVSVEIFNTLQHKYNETQNELQRRMQKMNALDMENKECNTKCDTLTNENQILNEQMTRMTKENEGLKERNLSYLSTYPQVDPDEFETAKEEVESLTQQLKSNAERNDARVMQLQQEIEQKSYEIERLKKEFKQKMDTKERKLNELQRNTETQINELMQSMKSITRHHDEIKLQLKTEEQEKAKLKLHHEEQIKKLKQQMKVVTQQYHSMRDKLQTELKQKMAAKDAEIAKIQSDVDKGKVLIGKMKGLLDNKKSILNAKQQQIETLTSKHKIRMDEIQALDAQLRKAMDTQKALKEDMKHKTKQLTDTQKAYVFNVKALQEAHKADIAALDDDKKCLMEQVETANRSKTEISELMATSLDAHEKEMKEKQQLIEKMKNVLAAKKLKLEKLENETRVLKKETIDLQAQTKEVKQSETQMKQEIASKQNTVELYNALKQTIRQKDKSIQSITAQLQQKLLTQERLQAELKAQKTESEQKLSKVKKEYGKVYQALVKKKAENGELSKKQKDTVALVEKLKRELQKKTECVQSVMLVLNKYKTEKRELQQRNEKQTQQLTQLQQEMKQRMKAIDGIEKELKEKMDAKEIRLNECRDSTDAQLKQINELVESMTTLKASLRKEAQEKAKAKEQMKKLTQIYKSMRDKLQNELKDKMAAKEEEIVKLQSVVDEGKVSMDQMKANLCALQSTDKQNTELRESIKRINKNHAEIMVLYKKAEQDKTTFKTQHGEQVMKLKQTLQQKQQEIVEYVQKNTKIQSYFDELAREYKEREALHDKEVKALQNTLKEEGIKYQNIHELAGDYQNENKGLKEKLTKLELQKDVLSQEIKKLNTQLVEKGNENTQMMTQINELMQSMKSITRHHDEIKLQLKTEEQEKAKLKLHHEEQIKKLKQQMKVVTQQYHSMRDKLQTELKQKMAAKDAEIAK